jgi:hypothetical protein
VRPEQQTHPCLSWAKKNLAIVAAWMIVASQLKNDITHIDNSPCLFELGYDLALAPNNNVSDSPGFESCGLKRKD